MARRSKKSGTDAAALKRIALSFPEAVEKPSYGRPAYFVGKKFFTRYRAEDDSLVLVVSDMAQRDMMLELDPETYFITEHYRNYPTVLVRLSRINADELQTMLERRWRAIAPKKLMKEIEDRPNLSSPASGAQRQLAHMRGKGIQVVKKRKSRK